MLDLTPAKTRARLGQSLGHEKLTDQQLLSALQNLDAWPEKAPLRSWLLGCAAHYLGRENPDGRPADAVARFHLGNGARIEKIHWAADLSPKGMRQSFGLMVNYLYDLRNLDRHRRDLARGRIPVSEAVTRLFF